MDCSVVPLKFKDFYLLETTDFFYPLIDNPYRMGQIACANVLSDLYALGVVDVDNMHMILALSTKMGEQEREIVSKLIIEGFRDKASEAEVQITGGHTVYNPWCTLGGAASSVCIVSEFILPTGLIEGDVLVLTKPLGTQLAVMMYSWLEKPEKWDTIKNVISPEEVRAAYHSAVESMVRLNRTAARLMHKFQAHAATDVTGFGILGHAQTLIDNQPNNLRIMISNLPVFHKLGEVAKASGYKRLLSGTAPETSGGLLIAFRRENAASFIKDLEEAEPGSKAFVVGYVEQGDSRTVKMVDTPRVIDVPLPRSSGHV